MRVCWTLASVSHKFLPTPPSGVTNLSWIIIWCCVFLCCGTQNPTPGASREKERGQSKGRDQGRELGRSCMCFPRSHGHLRPPGADAEEESGMQEISGSSGEGSCLWKANHREEDRRTSIISNCDADLVSLSQASGGFGANTAPQKHLAETVCSLDTTSQLPNKFLPEGRLS